MLFKYVLIVAIVLGFLAGLGGYIEYEFDFYPAVAAEQSGDVGR